MSLKTFILKTLLGKTIWSRNLQRMYEFSARLILTHTDSVSKSGQNDEKKTFSHDISHCITHPLMSLKPNYLSIFKRTVEITLNMYVF